MHTAHINTHRNRSNYLTFINLPRHIRLHDHKLTDPGRHKQWCGADNTRILANFKEAYETFPNTKFIARTPLIPGVNDDEDHVRAVLAFIRPHKNVIDYELLPYHRFGEGKDGFLGGFTK